MHSAKLQRDGPFHGTAVTPPVILQSPNWTAELSTPGAC